MCRADRESGLVTLWLASKSETRRAILEAAGVDFGIVASDFDEDKAKAGLIDAGFEPRDLAEMLAELKAKKASVPAGDIVLGADQTLERRDGSLLSKPSSAEEARAQLRSLAGTTHQLHSAAVLVRNGERLWGSTESVTLTMRDFSDSFLDTYVEREYEHIRWNVGAYRIEGFGIQLFEAIQGSHFAILGLPLLSLLAGLRAQGLLPR
jgi:septum formation protein